MNNYFFGSNLSLDSSIQALMLLVAVLTLLATVAGLVSPTGQAEPPAIVVLEQAEPAPTVPVEPIFVQV